MKRSPRENVVEHVRCLFPVQDSLSLPYTPNPDKPEPKKAAPSLPSAKNPLRHTLRVFLALLKTLLGLRLVYGRNEFLLMVSNCMKP